MIKTPLLIVTPLELGKKSVDLAVQTINTNTTA